MKQLIAISQTKIDRQNVETVNARELHAFLEIKARYNDWFARRVAEYGFEEGKDYVTFTQKRVKGRPQVDHFITIDMAKELSMVERNAKGKQARRYFIECEKIAKSKPTEWQKIRSEGKAARNWFTDALRDNGCSKPHHYMNCTKAISKAATGKTPAEIKRERGVTNSRDGLTIPELAKTTMIEVMAEEAIRKTNSVGFDSCYQHTKLASQAVKVALEAHKTALASIGGAS